MSRTVTVLKRVATVATLVAVATIWAQAQAQAQSIGVSDWYHVGNSVLDLSLAGLASGAGGTGVVRG